ncbi:CDP-glycerol glycerophosphotransferase family protein [Nocardioides sp. WL0053]|uniref:CDP-glycerol glycerophosphotransferase family protein n=1 Tax=Nocardioides jiangsuensis TaxID=2866161 RepID=A0ABS7RET7_9ACTN|nr:CDP-glycerol glycerophosphotransferase family protein [Nocardioides jiangsuensis]MBY9073517.1 CDP-glycerol glycerophosphotransferase family protein [Nocardioides jiangsuensis]
MLSRLRQLRVVRVLVRRLGVHRVTAAVGLVQAPCLALVGLTLRRLPRNRRLVVLGSPLDRFADNAAYLFLHMAGQAARHRLEVVWISGSADVVQRLRSHGYRAEHRWSWRGALTTLGAGTFVYSGYRSDINRWLSPGATAVCLWHGLPIKRVESAVGGEGERRSGLLHAVARAGREAPPDFLIAPSDFVASRFSPAFGVPPERCWRLGYPRNDHLVTDPARPPAALVWHGEEWDRLRSARVVVGLFLTWRDDRVDDAVDTSLVQQLARVCAAHGGVLAYKAHYNVAATEVPSAGCVPLPADADLHAYLGLCDVLVTDYSSIALDYLLMRRPVVFYTPDLEHYAATRGFEIEPQSLPGVLTRDPQALLDSVDRLLAQETRAADGDDGTVSHDLLLRTLWGGYDGGASEAITAAIAQASSTAGPAAPPSPESVRPPRRGDLVEDPAEVPPQQPPA